MKNINPLGLFDGHFLLERLTKFNDPLKKLNRHIDWNLFSPVLNQALIDSEKDETKGGRPPFDRLMMFNILIIQGIYKYQTSDGISNHRQEKLHAFVGIENKR